MLHRRHRQVDAGGTGATTGDRIGADATDEVVGVTGPAPGRVVADAGRENFQRDETIQLFLSRFVNCAHAAFTDEFEDFKLRKERREFGDGWRDERRLFAIGDGVRCRAHLEQASGAKSGERACGQRRAALRAFVSVGHWRREFYCVHASFRSKSARTLPEFFNDGGAFVVNVSQPIHEFLHHLFLLLDGFHEFELRPTAVEIMVGAMYAEIVVTAQEVGQEADADFKRDEFAGEGHQAFLGLVQESTCG